MPPIDTGGIERGFALVDALDVEAGMERVSLPESVRRAGLILG